MDMQSAAVSHEPPASHSAFEFTGTWREYAPIAFTNLLLTIVTLGIYRFWASTRERRYLWSSTRFIDDRLEWTGTGMELFIGAIMAAVLFGIPFLVLSFATQALSLQGQFGWAVLLTVVAYLAIFYLVGIATFRALRYRLSRTYWHGIRGGSDTEGLVYGWSYLWKTIAGSLAAGLLIPWSMCALWHERWQHMSFGPHRFESHPDFSQLMGRFILCYLIPLGTFILTVVVFAMVTLGSSLEGNFESTVTMTALAVGFGLLFYVGLGIAAAAFYAKFYRVAIGATHLHDLQFGFDASTLDWFKLVLVDIALVIGTLGIGAIFLNYRHWKFFITHMEAYGEVDVDALTQSETRMSKQGEGLLDAFDVGAI